MMASIALRHDLSLVFGNTRRFARVPKIEVANWFEE